jgi:TPR repeat protein
MLLSGEGAEQNVADGIWWLRFAARPGEAKAQYNLGRAYRYGEGISRNKRWARVWLNKAAVQGHTEAVHMLAELDHRRPVT